jgi:ABC-type multidrug transport system ATPase subunit
LTFRLRAQCPSTSLRSISRYAVYFFYWYKSTNSDAAGEQTLPADFQVGLLVGPSGSGKTSLLRKFGKITDPTWPQGEQVRSHSAFGTAAQAEELLEAVGLNSGHWQRSYATLSEGERARADAAALLAGGARGGGEVLIDEFTSLLDRRAARVMSEKLAAYVTRNNVKGVVLATCHMDVIRMLGAGQVLGWVLQTDTGRLYTGEALKTLIGEVEEVNEYIHNYIYICIYIHIHM